MTFPEPPEGLVKPEHDSVVAFLDGPDQVEDAMEQLVQEGFDGERICVLCGAKAIWMLNSYVDHGLESFGTGLGSRML